MIWRCRDRVLDLDGRVLVMGVLNVTPDSFSDGGRFLEPAAAIEHGVQMAAQHADIIDVGAESTRPGAEPVDAEEQWDRLEPVVLALAAKGLCLSVDTASARVAARALAAGVSIINDVSAMRDPAMAEVVAGDGAGLVLVHMRGTPADMQRAPEYDDVAREVLQVLRERLDAAQRAGVDAECVACDPGIGFGKRPEHNLQLIARLGELRELGRPLVVGASRKSFLGALTGAPVDQRLGAGLAAHVLAMWGGASVIRTHDVPETVQAVELVRSLAAAKRRDA